MMKKEEEMRLNLIGQGFTAPPEESFTRVNIIGEISHCENFEDVPL